jgi:hypothetical protein
VAEKSGLIKVFDNLTDKTPSVFADLRTQVHNYWDRGLLDIALAPGFPTDPWVYMLYTYDAPSGESRPRGDRWAAPSMVVPHHRGRRPTVASSLVICRAYKLPAMSPSAPSRY